MKFTWKTVAIVIQNQFYGMTKNTGLCLPAACCLLPAACCLLPAACCLLPAACCENYTQAKHFVNPLQYFFCVNLRFFLHQAHNTLPAYEPTAIVNENEKKMA